MYIHKIAQLSLLSNSRTFPSASQKPCPHLRSLPNSPITTTFKTICFHSVAFLLGMATASRGTQSRGGRSVRETEVGTWRGAEAKTLRPGDRRAPLSAHGLYNETHLLLQLPLFGFCDLSLKPRSLPRVQLWGVDTFCCLA